MGCVGGVRGTSGHVSDIAEAKTLLHGEESVAFGDAGYQGVEKRPDAKNGVTWHIAMRPGERAALDRTQTLDSSRCEVIQSCLLTCEKTGLASLECMTR